MNKKSESDKVYELLKKRIVYLDYKPGMVLNEMDIANEFNISRTPIREIFQKLSRDNLLNIIPRFGAQVHYIDFKYMKSVFEVTRELEPFAVKIATPRISDNDIKELDNIINNLNSFKIATDYRKAIIEDEKFHQTILKNCNNPCLQNILGELHIHTERLWHYSEQYIDSMDIFTNTLGKVLQSIKENDLSKVEKYSREHIDTFVQKIKEKML